MEGVCTAWPRREEKRRGVCECWERVLGRDGVLGECGKKGAEVLVVARPHVKESSIDNVYQHALACARANVGWRGCSVDGTIAAAMEEGGRKKVCDKCAWVAGGFDGCLTFGRLSDSLEQLAAARSSGFA